MTEIVKMMAAKLGFRDEVRVISKACEYERLLKLRASGTTALSDSARAVICLDMGASLFGLPFDMEQGLKLAAVKKSSYIRSRHTVCKLLGVESGCTVATLSVQLSCPAARELAESILQQFKDADVKDSDLTHPQFACMAVYQACRIDKIKVSKSKLISQSHLKSSQWNELETEWTKMVDEFVKTRTNRVKGNGRKVNHIEVMSEKYSEMTTTNKKASHQQTEPEIEDYEVWKARTLKQAYKELGIDNKDVPTVSIKMMKQDFPKIDRENGIRLVF